MARSLTPESQQLELARALLARKLRTTPAHGLTGLPETELRRLYHQVHGCSPSSGSIPSTAHLLTSRRRQVKCSAFLEVYLALGPKEAPIDGERLVAAFDLYRALSGEIEPEIDLTGAWSVVREYKAGLTLRKICRSCEGRYLLAPRSILIPNCPYCALRERGLRR